VARIPHLKIEMWGTLSIMGAEGGAEGFEADPVAGAFVAEDGAPAAGVVEGAVRGAADNVGAGAGDDEDAGAGVEGGVEGDFIVAEEEERAGDAGGDGLRGPVADGGNGEAGEADAGAGDLGERDAGGGGDFGEHGVEAGGGFGLGGAHELDGAGGGAGEDAFAVGEETVGFGAAGVDG
jgi:hypothetical protein